MEQQLQQIPQKAKIQPSMYRVYKLTVQRVPVNIKSLSSHAAFLITLDGEKQVIAWIGSDCESADSDLVRELGLGVMTKDYRLKDTTEVPVILEGSEPVPLLEAVLEIFWSNSNTYFSKITSSERKQKMINNSVSVGLIEKISTGSEVYDFQETAFAHPDSRGTVPRVTFVPIEMKTIAYVNVGEQWDIWISRGVSEEEERNVMVFLENAISSQIALGSTAFKKEVLSQYIQVARQGEERFLFRRPLKIFTDFEPPGKTAPKPEPKLRPRVETVKRRPEEEEEKKDDETYGSSSTVKSSTPKNVVSPNNNKGGKNGISFKTDTNFFGFDANGYEDPDKRDDSQNAVPLKDEAVHQYVDFYSVHGTFHHGHMEHKTTGELELSMNDIDAMNRPLSDGDDFNGDGYRALPTQVQTNPDGSPIVTPDMLKVVEKDNISPSERAALLKAAATNPSAIVGYQVEIDEGIFAGVFVVTKTQKNLFHKSVYHLSAADGDEFWLRLQRGPGKKGQKFRPLRRVAPEVQ